MKVTRKEMRAQTYVASMSCDVCGKTVTNEDFIEFQEWLSIDIFGGYGSIFGDGVHMTMDMCQECVNDILGKYLAVSDETL